MVDREFYIAVQSIEGIDRHPLVLAFWNIMDYCLTTTLLVSATL